MDTEEVEEYVEQSRSLLEDAPQMDEATTRMRLVQPFISLLGWDVYSSEVEPEFSVQLGAGTKKVDYALMLEESPVVFIEVKGCDRTLSETDKQQLQSYMRVVGVDWGGTDQWEGVRDSQASSGHYPTGGIVAR